VDERHDEWIVRTDEDLLIKYVAGKTREYQYWVLDTGITFL
jgi:hypothetical protein